MYRFNSIVTKYGTFDVEEVGPEGRKTDLEIRNPCNNQLCGIIRGKSLNEFEINGEEETEIDYDRLAEEIVNNLTIGGC